MNITNVGSCCALRLVNGVGTYTTNEALREGFEKWRVSGNGGATTLIFITRAEETTMFGDLLRELGFKDLAQFPRISTYGDAEPLTLWMYIRDNAGGAKWKAIKAAAEAAENPSVVPVTRKRKKNAQLPPATT